MTDSGPFQEHETRESSARLHPSSKSVRTWAAGESKVADCTKLAACEVQNGDEDETIRVIDDSSSALEEGDAVKWAVTRILRSKVEGDKRTIELGLVCPTTSQPSTTLATSLGDFEEQGSAMPPKPIPPTAAQKLMPYGVSFERSRNDVKMLDTQYRMDPPLSAGPSEWFFEGNLKDAEKVIA